MLLVLKMSEIEGYEEGYNATGLDMLLVLKMSEIEGYGR